MSYLQPSMSPSERRPLISRDTGSSISPRLVIGVALLALGAGLLALGILHGFQNGSCSTTGYDRHYGPVPQCGKGIGWWMLMLMAGLVIFGSGAAVSGVGALAGGVLFVAIGAPFISLGLGGAKGQLLLGSSASTGRLSAGIFGGCFAVAGLVWAVLSGRDGISELSAGSRLSGILAAATGVGIAFVIAAGVASAIGQSATAAKRSGVVISPPTAALSHANRAIRQANAQGQQATKLAACVTAAGTNVNRIQACERKYVP